MTLECTFTPLARNRFRCNHLACRTADGKPVVVKRNSLEAHRSYAFNRRNPRKRPPEPYRPDRTDSQLKLVRIAYDEVHAYCPHCGSPNRVRGVVGSLDCWDCEEKFAFKRLPNPYPSRGL